MSVTTRRRRGPAPGTPRPKSVRVPVSTLEHKQAKMLAATEGRPLSAIVREDIARRVTILGLDAGKRKRGQQ